MFEDRSLEGPPFRYCVKDILTQLFGHSCYGSQNTITGENLGSKSPDGNVAAAVLDSEAAEQSLVRRNQSYEHGYRIRRMG
jgi:hypothetical protein